MALQGYTELQFSYDKFKHIDFSSGKKKNNITPWVQNAIGAGNFHSMMQQGKIMPLLQWFNGCQLFDKEHENALSTSMMDYDANIVACSGSGTNAGDLANNTKLGVFQAEPSGMTADGKGYQFVWEWGTAYGNGDIKSVCLTRDILAIADILEATDTGKACTLPYFVDAGQLTGASYDASMLDLIDYETGRGYIFAFVSSGSISITEYDLSTKYIKVNGGAGQTIKQIGDAHVFTGLTDLANNRFSVNYTGTSFRVFWFVGSTINEVEIPLSTWTAGSITAHTYTGASFSDGIYSSKDRFPLKSNHLFLMSSNRQKIYDCDLSNTDIEEIDNPIYTVLNLTPVMGGSILLPNGDIYWHGNSDGGDLSLHNGKWRAVKPVTYGYYPFHSLNGNSYGTVIRCHPLSYAPDRRIGLNLMHGYVSTVNNLGQTYTKNSSMSMRLIYTVTEV